MDKKVKRRLIWLAVAVFVLLCLIIFDTVKKSGQYDSSPLESGEELFIENVWISTWTEDKIQIFFEGFYLDFPGPFDAVGESESVADITVKDGALVHIKVKSDTIYGKILALSSDLIEIEGYGELTLSGNFRIFQTFGELAELTSSDIQIGYEGAEFFVAGNEVCGIIYNEVYVPEEIRVLIKTTDYTDVYHQEVILTSDKDFTITDGEQTVTVKAGEELTIDSNSEYFESSRIKIKSKAEAGEIRLTSVNRLQGNPSYLGTLEIEKREEGLLIINELSLEHYLYSVVPSEMPVSYDMEALKAQAVAARSYAYIQMLGNGCAEYGAHVDDSIIYQVYNNIEKTEESIGAVDATYGQVLYGDNGVVETYYYSTSCGHGSTDSVWMSDGSSENSYLKSIELNEKGNTLNLSDEDAFYEFITSVYEEHYECEEGWYRWKADISMKAIEENINANIYTRWNANKNNILTKNDEGEFESLEIKTVGSVTKVEVSKRSDSGVIQELLIYGSDKTILVKTEYNVRVFLLPDGGIVTKNDETKVEGQKLLPSAYIFLEENLEENELTGYHILGGGYGHGVGMSQNAARNMAEDGKTYDEILYYFFNAVELYNIYE